MLKYTRKESDDMKERKMKSFVMTTMNGMVYGLFATLIIGVIFRQVGILLNITLLEVTVFQRLAALMGMGIGAGIALSLKLDGLKMVVVAIMGGIATSFKVTFGDGLLFVTNNDPVTTYLVVVFGYLLLTKIAVKKTPVDILLIPLLGISIAILLTLGFSAPVGYVISLIEDLITNATRIIPIPMSIIIAIIMGMLLTSPLSSAAIAISISLSGIAGGAAVVGCTVQMIGFAVQSRKDNSIGMVLSIAFGTSMLQFKNILRKPIIWLPTIIASGILAPIMYILFKTETSREGAGMGSSGLVGQLQTLETMDYSLNAWFAVITMILGGALLVYFIDLVFRKKNLIVDQDLAVNKDI